VLDIGWREKTIKAFLRSYIVGGRKEDSTVYRGTPMALWRRDSSCLFLVLRAQVKIVLLYSRLLCIFYDFDLTM